MFKGFIPMKGKRPTEKVRGRTNFYELEEVEHLNEYGGVLSDDFIMIDVDEYEQSETLLKIINDLNIKCNMIQTSRGKHFYFKNTQVTSNAIQKVTAIGITVDVKLGCKNAVVPLKIDGKVRPITILDEVDPLPIWLTIIHNVPDFNNLEDGDGRNQTFFNYILKLQSNVFGKEDIKETIEIINKYILKDPLTNEELEVILRDEAFSKPNFYGGANGKTFLHDKFAEYLRNEENIVKIDGILHIYKDGIYSDKCNDIEKAMIKYIPMLTKSKRTEVLNYLELIAPERQLSPGTHIVVANGLLNIETMDVEDFTPSYISKNKIPIAYNPAAYNESMDKTLDKIACNNQNLRYLIEEMIGYCLLRRNELGKSFILTGEGSNGKSTLLDVIKELIGKENISSVSLGELGQRFKTAELYGKLANIGDDISNNYIDDNSLFKKLVTGETVNVERKGKDPFDYNNYSKLIFSANEIPRINDTSNGLKRRLVLIPFKAKFSKNDPDFDPFIKDKLLSNEALEYLLAKAFLGLLRVLFNRAFTEVAAVEEELYEYEKLNNPVIAFLDEGYKIENESTSEVYTKYATYCLDSRLKPLSKIAFGKEMSKRGFKSKQVKIDGRNIRVYVTDSSK